MHVCLRGCANLCGRWFGRRLTRPYFAQHNQPSTVFASIYAWVQGRQYSYSPEDWQRCLVAPNKGGVGAGECVRARGRGWGCVCV